MKLIPKSHTVAMNWVNQAWAMLELTPLDTAQLLAKLCGFSDWDQLSAAISAQTTEGEFLLLKRGMVEPHRESEWVPLIAEHARLILEKRSYRPEFLGAFMTNMSPLRMQEIFNHCSTMHTSLCELLAQIQSPESDDEEEIERLILGSGLSETLGREINPKGYRDFALAMGWKVIPDTFVANYVHLDASFYVMDSHGIAIPVFVFPLETQPWNERDMLAGEIVAKVEQLARLADWPRAVIMWGDCLQAMDKNGEKMSFVGCLLEKGEWHEMFITQQTDSIDRLFALCERISIDIQGTDGFLPYMIDRGDYAARLHHQHIWHPDEG